VILKCSINSNKWAYEWFKDGTQVSANKDIIFSGNTLSISSAQASHSGLYTCRGKHLRTPVTTRQAEALKLHIHGKTTLWLIDINVIDRHPKEFNLYFKLFFISVYRCSCQLCSFLSSLLGSGQTQITENYKQMQIKATIVWGESIMLYSTPVILR